MAWTRVSKRELATLCAAVHYWTEELAHGEDWIYQSLYFAEYSPLSVAEVNALEKRLRHHCEWTSSPELGSNMGPMKITTARMSATAVVEEILAQAEARGIVWAVAALLVGSKLEVCLGEQRVGQVAAQHKWKTEDEHPTALGDYRIENVAIAVTMARRPDELHRAKANAITERGTDECWLIVRSDKIKAWHDYLAKAPSRYPALINCLGIGDFIGQSLALMELRSTVPIDPLHELIEKLNELTARLGPQFLPSARVELIG
jgi:hypothetical protein